MSDFNPTQLQALVPPQRSELSITKDAISTRKYRVKHRKAINARKREYYAKNRDAIATKTREYRAKNREALTAKVR
jgi:hypothetical protein